MEKAFGCISAEPSSVPSVFQNIKSVEAWRKLRSFMGTMMFALK